MYNTYLDCGKTEEMGGRRGAKWDGNMSLFFPLDHKEEKKDFFLDARLSKNTCVPKKSLKKSEET